MKRRLSFKERRHARLAKLSHKTKIVRIDSRTQIECSVSIPDEEAINNYHLRHDLVLHTADEQYKYPMSVAEALDAGYVPPETE